MRQLESYADERLTTACIYCGRATQTRDHVPSRVLLNGPYPNNLPVVPACNECNRGYSLDEEYFACLVECARTGSVQAAQRRKIIRILSECPALTEKLSRARSIHENGSISFFAEQQRIKNVALKLTRGHAYFEVSETMHHEPSHFLATPLATLDEFARNHFETVPTSSIWLEVGSRAMQRLIISNNDVTNEGWIEVQTGQYRYFVVAEGPVMVRFVVSEYLACEVIWDYIDL